MIIDFHIHVFPDNAAEKAVTALSAPGGLSACVVPRVKDVRRRLDERGIYTAVNMPVATRPDQAAAINRYVAALEGVCSFGALHPDDPAPRRTLDDLLRLGLRGVKLHPEYMGFCPDDPAYAGVFGMLADAGVAVLSHSGRDLAFDTLHSTPRTYAALKRRHPRLTLIAAHLGGWRCWRETVDTLLGSDIYLDTAYTAGVIDPALFETIVRNHREDRLLFGSDLPWQDPARGLEQIASLDLTEDRRRALLSGNARRLLGLPETG